MEPCSVSTAATRRTPKSSVRTRMPVTGQFSMTWKQEGLPSRARQASVRVPTARVVTGFSH